MHTAPTSFTVESNKAEKYVCPNALDWRSNNNDIQVAIMRAPVRTLCVSSRRLRISEKLMNKMRLCSSYEEFNHKSVATICAFRRRICCNIRIVAFIKRIQSRLFSLPCPFDTPKAARRSENGHLIFTFDLVISHLRKVLPIRRPRSIFVRSWLTQHNWLGTCVCASTKHFGAQIYLLYEVRRWGKQIA